jgi:hypothetical protein
MKIYNLEVYMHPRICMHEHFDLISNPFKYKCETCPRFLYVHFKKLWWAQNATHE